MWHNVKMAAFFALLLFTLPTVVQSANGVYWTMMPEADVGHQCSAELPQEQWTTFVSRFAKNYSSQSEEFERSKIFHDNLDFIRRHNQQVNISYELGVTKFADLTLAEYRSRFHGGFDRFDDLLLRQKAEQELLRFDFFNYILFTDEVQELPKHKDWRDEGAVTRVKDQADCGSCWAFSAVGAIEAQNFFHKGQLVELSEQHVVDCASNLKYKAKGCDGGLAESGFQFVEESGGIASEASYPYVGHLDACSGDGTVVGVAKIRSFARIVLGSEQALQKVVARIGPVAVSVDARHRSFQLYKGGVYAEPLCEWFLTSHALLVVGYGHDQESGQDYWLAKNSWGDKWGEQGYMRIARNQENHCGIATNAMFPI